MIVKSLTPQPKSSDPTIIKYRCPTTFITHLSPNMVEATEEVCKKLFMHICPGRAMNVSYKGLLK